MKAEVNNEPMARDGEATKRAGSRPNWTGVGAAGGAIAGAAIGAVAGPVGAFLGLMACALAGGLAGKGVAEKSELLSADNYLKERYLPRVPLENSAGYSAEEAVLRTRYEFPIRDRGRKYLEVAPGFVARLRDAQTFQSNLG